MARQSPGVRVDLREIGDAVIENIRRELRRYAKAGKIQEPPGEGTAVDPFGVMVVYHQSLPIVRFSGVTDDDIYWHAAVDFRAYNREYHEHLIKMVGDHITDKRRERRGLGPIVLLGDLTTEELTQQ